MFFTRKLLVVTHTLSATFRDYANLLLDESSGAVLFALDSISVS